MLLRLRCGNSSLDVASKDVRPLTKMSDAAITRMAGNGMHLGSAAFCCFIAMMCLSTSEPSMFQSDDVSEHI